MVKQEVPAPFFPVRAGDDRAKASPSPRDSGAEWGDEAR